MSTFQVYGEIKWDTVFRGFISVLTLTWNRQLININTSLHLFIFLLDFRTSFYLGNQVPWSFWVSPPLCCLISKLSFIINLSMASSEIVLGSDWQLRTLGMTHLKWLCVLISAPLEAILEMAQLKVIKRLLLLSLNLFWQPYMKNLLCAFQKWYHRQIKPLIRFSQEGNVYFDYVNTWSSDYRWVASVFMDIWDGGFLKWKDLNLEGPVLEPVLPSLLPSLLLLTIWIC